MSGEKRASEMTEDEARAALSALAEKLAVANKAYHADDAPEISDADYDHLKRRNREIEDAFPHLKRADSPTEQVGAAPAVAESTPSSSMGASCMPAALA